MQYTRTALTVVIPEINLDFISNVLFLQMTKSMISKKIDDLKNRLRKLCKDERDLMKQVEELVSN